MKKNGVKKIVGTVVLSGFIGLAWFHTPINAVLGVVFVAAQGPSVPKVMSPKQVFEKKRCTSEEITSDDSSIIQATTLEKKFLLEAKRPGTTQIKILKDGKVKKTHTIIVAYNNISEFPSTVEIGTKLYCVITPKQVITCKSLTNGNKICRIAKKRQGVPFFYEIKFIAEGQVELSDGVKKHTMTVVACKNTGKTKQKKKHKTTYSDNKKIKGKNHHESK